MENTILKSLKNIKIMDLNVPNRNSWIYSTKVMQEALDDNVLKEKLENKMLFGEYIPNYLDIK
mgnify:CR=1 FL=1